MPIPIPQCAFAALVFLLSAVACSRSDGEAGEHAGHSGQGVAQNPEALRTLAVPDEHRQGEALFEANCAVCHGGAALGTQQGPPLVHIYYEPNHHSDAAFYLAVAQGVRAHHWNFGNMPAVPGLAEEEVSAIVAYIRWLQRQAGIG